MSSGVPGKAYRGPGSTPDQRLHPARPWRAVAGPDPAGRRAAGRGARLARPNEPMRFVKLLMAVTPWARSDSILRVHAPGDGGGIQKSVRHEVQEPPRRRDPAPPDPAAVAVDIHKCSGSYRGA